jgi:ATP-binding cassette, subfamily B, bacterial MsbA
VKAYIRLLGYLRPYTGRLMAAIFCMVLYAAMSGLSLGMISPFMQVLFARERYAAVHEMAAPAENVAPGGAVRPAEGTSGVTGRTAPGPASDLTGAAATAASASRPRLDLAGLLPPAWRAKADALLLDAPPLVALERICVLFLIVFLIKNASDYLQAFLMVSVEQAAIRDLRDGLFAHLHRLSLAFFHGRKTGTLISRVTNDVEYLRASLAAGISNLIKDSLTLFVSLAWAFWVSWKLALLSMVILPPAVFTLTLIGRKMRKRSGQAQERMGDLTGILQESLAGVRVVKAFGAEPHEAERFRRADQRYYRAFVHLRRVSAAARPLSEYALVMVAVAMLWLGGREIFQSGSLAPQQFMLFIGALLTTISPIKSLAEVNANVQQGVAAAQRVFDLLDTAPDVVDRPGARAAAPLRERITFEDVSFAYESDRPVLHDIRMEIHRGEVVAMVGSSGAGKSTAMDLLARFYDPTGGRIVIDGVDLRDLTVASWRARLGIVTQETILFHDTIRANIAYGMREATDEAVREAARAANAQAFIERLPQGYDTVIGDRGVRLSGGERQRLAIARALLKNPPILLLDEATSALDTESERLVQGALERLMRDRTVLVIAHRLSTVQHADRILVFEKGRIVASGRHAELIEQDGLYRRLYDLQFVA